VGFESSRIARRRLAALATTNDCVQEALAPSHFPGLFADKEIPLGGDLDVINADATHSGTVSALARQLDLLAQEIVATPGAGGALLAAYAAQARALTMVIEAARRAGDLPLPQSVLAAAQEALEGPGVLAGLAVA
jgi:hypothetical protein